MDLLPVNLLPVWSVTPHIIVTPTAPVWSSLYHAVCTASKLRRLFAFNGSRIVSSFSLSAVRHLLEKLGVLMGCTGGAPMCTAEKKRKRKRYAFRRSLKRSPSYELPGFPMLRLRHVRCSVNLPLCTSCQPQLV